MINLIKNELIKIFHKKGLYILGGIILLLALINIISFTLNKKDDMYSDEQLTMIEKGLDKYDLSKEEDLLWYVQEKVDLEIRKLLKNYDYNSYQFYYIDTFVRDVLTSLYNAKYISKTDYYKYEVEYNELVSVLENYDWRDKVNLEKREILDEIQKKLVLDSDDKTLSDTIFLLNCRLEVLNYRLKNNIAPSYDSTYNWLDTYGTDAASFIALQSNLNVYNDRSKLIEKRIAEERYYISKYKLDNNITPKSEVMLKEELIYLSSSIDIIVIIALLIIVGGVIAEEFNKGTIKQLLLRPYCRFQILASKIIACLIAFLVFMIFYFLVDLLFVALQNNDFKSIFDVVLVYDYNKELVIQYSVFHYCLIRFLAICPIYLILFMFVIFMGILTTSTIGAIVSGIGLYIGSNLINGVVPAKIAAYLPTNCWNLEVFLFGGISPNEYASLNSSLIVIFITMFILVFGSFYLFKHKDIKNQ